MRVLITGVNGFIGKNLCQHLSERTDIDILPVNRESSFDSLSKSVSNADFIFHLAGVNRPEDPREFSKDNFELTSRICSLVEHKAQVEGKKTPIIFSSSTKAVVDSAYGISKREGENSVFSLGSRYDIPVHVFRLPNVFGKWSRPNYNSVVATFCYNVSQGLPVHINNRCEELTLVYVDDVISRFIQLLDGGVKDCDSQGFEKINPLYSTTVGELADKLIEFRDSRDTLMVGKVGVGLDRALYSTYLSFLRPEQFSYSVPQKKDDRGAFVEMLKTPNCGQFSFFTAHPGVTRGGHYHHTKTEKFLVIQGSASFKFRHMQTAEEYEILTCAQNPEVVETVPGWSHDITNIGENELICMLWANEIFDPDQPDTYAAPL